MFHNKYKYVIIIILALFIILPVIAQSKGFNIRDSFNINDVDDIEYQQDGTRIYNFSKSFMTVGFGFGGMIPYSKTLVPINIMFYFRVFADGSGALGIGLKDLGVLSFSIRADFINLSPRLHRFGHELFLEWFVSSGWSVTRGDVTVFETGLDFGYVFRINKMFGVFIQMTNSLVLTFGEYYYGWGEYDYVFLENYGLKFLIGVSLDF